MRETQKSSAALVVGPFLSNFNQIGHSMRQARTKADNLRH
jgi:hypothetical protein